MQKIFWLLMLAAFTVLIFVNSSLPMSESGRLSKTAADYVVWAGDILQINFDRNLEHYLRKLAHFTAFALEGFFLCKAFSSFKASNRLATGYILFFGLFIAVVDEYIQSFASGRMASVNDVLLDFSGVFTMWLAYRIWYWCR